MIQSDRYSRFLAGAAFSAILSATPATAATLHVPSVYPNVQAAIDAADPGDEVVLANGIYRGPGNREIHFDGKAVHLRSASGDPSQCVLDGQGQYRLFSLYLEGPYTVIEGIRINDGYGSVGGGAYLFGSSPTLINCEFLSCEASIYGGGAVYGYKSAPVFINCGFRWNTGGAGGAVKLFCTGNVRFISCHFEHNSSEHDGGAIKVEGARSSRIDLYGCVLRENVSHGEYVQWGAGGGAIDIVQTQTGGALLVRLMNCTLIYNHAFQHGERRHGSAVRIAGDGAVLTAANCIIWHNWGRQVQMHNGGYFAVSYSCITDYYAGGVGNIHVDPQLVDPLRGNVNLRTCSPCRDAGDNLRMLADNLDLDGDGDLSEHHPWDKAGRPRILGGTVNMGAIEDEPAAPEAGTILYVDASAAGDFSGDSWENAAFSLYQAVAVAAEGGVDEIRVAEGTYFAGSPYSGPGASIYLPDGVDIYGGFPRGGGQRDPVAHPTILTGLHPENADVAYHVVRAVNLTSPTKLDGFVVRNGFASGVQFPNDRAGGLLVDNAPDLELANCTFQWNASMGGGGAVAGLNANQSFNSCSFEFNRSGIEGSQGASAHGAGAVDINGGHPVLTGCVFRSNGAPGQGGAVRVRSGGEATFRDTSFMDNHAGYEGGAVWQHLGLLRFENCLFEENGTYSYAMPNRGRGGAVFSYNGDLEILDCRFARNTARGAGVQWGGAIFKRGAPLSIADSVFEENWCEDSAASIMIEESHALIVNSVFQNNRAEVSVGGIYATYAHSDVVVQGCTFADNIAATGFAGGMSAWGEARLNVENSLVWGNSDQSGSGPTSQIHDQNDQAGLVTVLNSTVQGGYPGEGNSDQLPQSDDLPDGEEMSADSPDAAAGVKIRLRPLIGDSNPGG